MLHLIYQSRKFPEVLKKAVISPILKSGDQLEIENCRPISLISNVAKIIEKCINIR